MYLVRALLLVASATLAGCGGGDGGGNSGGGEANPSSGAAAADALTLSLNSVTFNAAQDRPASLRLIDVASTSADVFIRTRQTGTMFSHTFTAKSSTTGQIAVVPAMPIEVGSFAGTITVDACSNASGPCNHVAGSP